MTDHFTVTRKLHARRELVFQSITKPEHFAVWFGTAAVDVPQESLTMDVRPGGEFRAVMLLPDGTSINWQGEYKSVEFPSHVAMTLSDQPGDDPGLPVLFDLEAVDGGTMLTIRQDRAGFSDDQVAATVAGYHAFIDDMEQVLRDME